MSQFICDACLRAIEPSQIKNGYFKCSCTNVVKFDDVNNDDLRKMLNEALQARKEANFDHARDLYNTILNDNPTSSEAIKGKLLSDLGILYQQEGTRYFPTFNRLTIESVYENRIYKQLVEIVGQEEFNKTYKAEFDEIERIRRASLELSNSSENDCDVFFCLKISALDNDGKPIVGQNTREYRWARDLYWRLKEKGHKVFFSEETLKGKTDKEPYIFRALQTAKLMFVFIDPKQPGNIKAPRGPWVQNEWIRFLKRREQNRSCEIRMIAVDEFVDAYSLFPQGFPQAQITNIAEPGGEERFYQIADEVCKRGGLSGLKIKNADITTEVGKKASEVKVSKIEQKTLGTIQVEKVEPDDKKVINNAKNLMSMEMFNEAAAALEKLEQKGVKSVDLVESLIMSKNYLKAFNDLWDNPKVWMSQSNRFDKQLLPLYSKERAEDFINRWMKAVIDTNSPETIKNYFLELASYDVSGRKDFIDKSEKIAVDSRNEELVTNITRTYNGNDVDRFIDFYTKVAESCKNAGDISGAKRYLNKVLEIHESNVNALFELYRIENEGVNILYAQNRDAFETICKFSEVSQRNKILEQLLYEAIRFSSYDTKSFEKTADYYLSMFGDPVEDARFNVLKAIYESLQGDGYFSMAEKYCGMTLAEDKNYGKGYWDLLAIKHHCRQSNDLEFSTADILNSNEYNNIMSVEPEFLKKCNTVLKAQKEKEKTGKCRPTHNDPERRDVIAIKNTVKGFYDINFKDGKELPFIFKAYLKDRGSIKANFCDLFIKRYNKIATAINRILSTDVVTIDSAEAIEKEILADFKKLKIPNFNHKIDVDKLMKAADQLSKFDNYDEAKWYKSGVNKRQVIDSAFVYYGSDSNQKVDSIKNIDKKFKNAKDSAVVVASKKARRKVKILVVFSIIIIAAAALISYLIFESGTLDGLKETLQFGKIITTIIPFLAGGGAVIGLIVGIKTGDDNWLLGAIIGAVIGAVSSLIISGVLALAAAILPIVVAVIIVIILFIIVKRANRKARRLVQAGQEELRREAAAGRHLKNVELDDDSPTTAEQAANNQSCAAAGVCPKCGVPATGRFCIRCGHKLN